MSPAEAKRKRRILVVDDDLLILETVRLALQQEGYEVEVLSDGDKAFELISAGKPDLVILDIYFPGFDGLELCRRLKADPGTRGIPIMIFSGSNETADVMRGIEAGAFQYITKPVDGEVLIAKIRQRLKDD